MRLTRNVLNLTRKRLLIIKDVLTLGSPLFDACPEQHSCCNVETFSQYSFALEYSQHLVNL